MNRLQAWAQAHKKVLLGSGAAAALALGLMARKRKAAGQPALSLFPGNSGPSAGRSTVIAPATYDSTSSDIYNSLEPILEDLQRQISNLGDQVAHPIDPLPTTPPVPAAPVPTPPAPEPVPAVSAPTPQAQPAPPPTPVAPVPTGLTINWGGNDPSVNPLVSSAPPVNLGDVRTNVAPPVLPPATGLGQRYQYTDANNQVYGFVYG